MTTPPLWIQLIGLLLALSGWGKVLYDLLTARPKVRGRILSVMRGQMQNPQQPNIMLTSFTTYLYLVNQRKNSVHLLDYEFEVKINGKWIELARVYAMHNIPNFTFTAPDGEPIVIKSFVENLVYRKNQAVDYGKPLQGWIVFAGDVSLHHADISCYRLTCIDAFGKKHVMENKTADFANIYLLQEMTDMSLPPSASRN